MSIQEEFSLKEIAQIALGQGSDQSQLNSINISLLYTIINLTLKKLNCENEKVTLSGVHAKHIQELLRKSNPPVQMFNVNEVEATSKRFEKLDMLGKKIERMESRLEDHISEIKQMAGTDDVPCTLLCDVAENPHPLLKDKWFNKQINVFLKVPLTCRFNRMNIRLRNLSEKLEKFKAEGLEAYEKINIMESLFINLVDLRRTVRENYSEFFTTMEEVQEVMDGKTNNAEMSPVKHSFHATLNELGKKVQYYEYQQKKPRALLAAVNPLSLVHTKKITNLDLKEKSCDCAEGLAPLPSIVERLDLLGSMLLRRFSPEMVSFSGR